MHRPVLLAVSLLVFACEKSGSAPDAATSSSGSPPSATSPASTPSATSRPAGSATGVDGTGTIRYLAIGDSLTQGIGPEDFEAAAFPARLTAKWKAKGCKVELKNAGIAGYTAGQMIQDEVPEIAAFKPTLITFQSGANDIANGVSPDEYRKNVRTIIEAGKKAGARVIVLLQNEWHRAPSGPDYGGTADKRNAYDAIMLEEIKARGVELADLRPLYKAEADKKLWVADGIHPPAKVYEEWATELARIISVPCATK